MIFIFDTDVLIDILREKMSTVEQVEKLTEEADELACSVITVGEIFSGMQPKEEKSTKALLNDLLKETVTEEVAELAGELRKRTRSHQLGLADCLIAATALLKGAALVTKNVKHYPFQGLKLIGIR